MAYQCPFNTDECLVEFTTKLLPKTIYYLYG
jgi:hypothetical protein